MDARIIKLIKKNVVAKISTWGSYPTSFHCSGVSNIQSHIATVLPFLKGICERGVIVEDVSLRQGSHFVQLRGCLACTDWTVFQDACVDIDELTDIRTCYTQFCVQ